jgi:hypothetical protein
MSDMVAMATMILSIPSNTRTEAFVVWPGLEHRSPVRQAVELWKARSDQDLIIAGYHEPEVAERELSTEALRSTFGLPEGEYLHSQVHARHSKDQAEWVADRVQDIGAESITLFAPAFHIVRAYITQLESFRRRGLEVCMVPMPTPIPPGRKVELAPHQEQWDLVAGEVARIQAYQEKGDAVTFLQLREYIDWMYSQPFLQSI